MMGDRRGFSLIEVVIATGIFSLVIVTMLALLPSLVRQGGGTVDALAAQRLPDPIHLELQRLAADGFDQLAAAIPLMSSSLENGLQLVADRDGVRVQAASYVSSRPADLIAQKEQYFAAEVWRFDRAPLRCDTSAAVMPLFVRVSWPYRLPGSATPTAMAVRSQFTFALVLAR
ncbi:MAG TPA: prepilin-type N-terminal cleavage/methylation domain-containing protein [Lacunisphaera sp.]|nr:prepilin-type N-terminal cleavage/methylation domain-containing protein [Lacunisphaera sp.]